LIDKNYFHSASPKTKNYQLENRKKIDMEAPSANL